VDATNDTRLRLDRLRERYGLSEDQLDRLTKILSVLAADEHAPTAVRDPTHAVDLHLADSLAALELSVLGSAQTIADLGTGAGFPGLALAVALPGAEVSLLDSQRRKCAFIERVCGAAQIGNAQVVCARAEEWREGLGQNDVVLARALAAQPVVLEYAAPLLRLGGTLVDWRGRRERLQEDMAEIAASELGLERVDVPRVQPWAGVRDRHLHVYVKVRETPGRFPRRPGMARKRPLGYRDARQ
jgi:16S rRNA (guanine527-N7)-methyltransferase